MKYLYEYHLEMVSNNDYFLLKTMIDFFEALEKMVQDNLPSLSAAVQEGLSEQW